MAKHQPRGAELTPMPSTARRLVPALRASALTMVIAVAVQSVGNVVLHGLLGRLLSPADYGALGALLGAVTLLAVPLGALQAATSAAAASDGFGNAAAIRILGLTLAWSAVAGLAVAAGAGLISDYLQLGSPLLGALLGAVVLVAAPLSAARGLLLGIRRVDVVAGSFVIATIVRLPLAYVWAMHDGVRGAMLATIVSEAAALALVASVAVRQDGPTRTVLGLRRLAMSVIAVAGLFLLTTADLFMARHYLHPDESGGYVAAATIGKTILALPAALMGVVFARLVAAHSGSRSTRGTQFRQAIALVCGPALAAAAGVALMPALVLEILYGDTYDGSESLVRALALIAGISSAATLAAQAALARRSRWLLVPWAGAAIEIIAISQHHGTPLQVAAGSLAGVAPAVILGIAVEARWWLADRPAASDFSETPSDDQDRHSFGR